MCPTQHLTRAPPQTPEFSALVPGWLCEYDASNARRRRVGSKFREEYSDRRYWPRIAGAIRPSCHPAAPLATEGPITFASLHGRTNLRKKASGGGKNREPLQSGLAAGSEPSEASQKAKVKAQKAKVRTGLCLRLFWVGVGKGPPTSKAGPCYACFYGYHGTTWGRKSPLSCLARLYQPRTTKRPPQE